MGWGELRTERIIWRMQREAWTAICRMKHKNTVRSGEIGEWEGEHRKWSIRHEENAMQKDVCVWWQSLG